MNNEKRYYMKKLFYAPWLIFGVVNLVCFIIRLEDIRQVLSSDGMLCLFASSVFFLVAIFFMRISISTTDDSIILRMWLSKQMEFQYRNITKVYKLGLSPVSLYMVEGKAGNKSIKSNIPVFINGWRDILRTVVSKVDAKIVDRKVLKMLGCEVPVKYLGCEASITCNGNSMSHEKSNVLLMILAHLIRFVQNFVILMIALGLSAFISKVVEPNSGILTLAIFFLFLIVTFFLIGYLTRVRRWIHLSLVNACGLSTAYLVGHYDAWTMFRLSLFFFIPMVIGGALSSKYSKKKEAD